MRINIGGERFITVVWNSLYVGLSPRVETFVEEAKSPAKGINKVFTAMQHNNSRYVSIRMPSFKGVHIDGIFVRYQNQIVGNKKRLSTWKRLFKRYVFKHASFKVII